jgi:large subunit ribosomal protein L4
VYKSARNIERVTVAPISQLTALCLLEPRRVLMTKAALDALRSRAGERASAAKGTKTKPKSKAKA